MKARFAMMVLTAALISGPVISGPAMAQASGKPAAASAPAPVPAKGAQATHTRRAQAPRTAKSLECSKQADAQNIHGKPRKTFMARCKKS